MGFLNKIENVRMTFFLWVGLPLIAFAGLFYGSQDIVPAWQAKNGSGVVGTFTAVRQECGRRSCSFHGRWEAADGSAKRSDVILHDEPDSLTLGGRTEARDTGDRNGVFATSGGYTYLLVTGFVVAGAAAAIGWVAFLLRTFRRRRPEAAEQQALSDA
jgi:hypothetical protein